MPSGSALWATESESGPAMDHVLSYNFGEIYLEVWVNCS